MLRINAEAPDSSTLPTPLRTLGFAAMLLFVFLLHSRVLDLGLHKLHIPSLTMYAAIAAAFLGGGVMRAFNNRVGMPILVLTAWMSMAVAFSLWRGGSLLTLKAFIKCVLIYFVIAALVYNWSQLRKVYHVFAFSVLTLAMIALALGSVKGGRLVLERGRFANPNDMGQILLMSLPFWWFMATNPRLRASRRILAWLATLPLLFTIAKTGSRGALLASAVVVAILFLRASLKHKLQLAALGAVVLAGAASAVPDAAKERFFTYFKPKQLALADAALAVRVEQDATSSARARWALLRDSVKLTLLHPVFGVGPGMFDVAQDLYSRKTRGVRGLWQVTHNTYTEVSSENGIPALVLYMLAIVFTWRAARVKKPRGNLTPRQAEIVSASFALRLALIGYCVSAFFASFAYQSQLMVLAGMAVALKRAAAAEFARAPAAESAAAPLPLSPAAHPVWAGDRIQVA